MTIDLLAEQFAVEVEIAEGNAAGDLSPEIVSHWQQLIIRGYNAQQLLESLHRHVKGLTMAEDEGNYAAFDRHLEMLNCITDEIEFRREQVQHEEN